MRGGDINMGFLKTSEPLGIHLKHTGFQVARERRALAGKRLIIPRKVSLGPKHLGVSEVENTLFSIGVQRSSPSNNTHVRKDLISYFN